MNAQQQYFKGGVHLHILGDIERERNKLELVHGNGLFIIIRSSSTTTSSTARCFILVRPSSNFQLSQISLAFPGRRLRRIGKVMYKIKVENEYFMCIILIYLK